MNLMGVALAMGDAALAAQHRRLGYAVLQGMDAAGMHLDAPAAAIYQQLRAALG